MSSLKWIYTGEQVSANFTCQSTNNDSLILCQGNKCNPHLYIWLRRTTIPEPHESRPLITNRVLLFGVSNTMNFSYPRLVENDDSGFGSVTMVQHNRVVTRTVSGKIDDHIITYLYPNPSLHKLACRRYKI